MRKHTALRSKRSLRFVGMFACLMFVFIATGCGSSKPDAKKTAKAPAAKDATKPATKPAAGSAAKPAGTAATKPPGAAANLPPGTSAAPPASAGGVVEIKDLFVIKAGKRITSIAFLPDGRIASAGEEGVDLWNPASPDEKKPLLQDGQPVKGSRVAVSPDGTILAAGGYYGDVHFWTIANGEYSHKLDEPSLFMQGLAFAPKGDLLACTHDQQKIMLCNLEKKAVVAKLSPPMETQCRGLAFSHDGTQVIGLWRKQLLAWDVATQQVKKDVPFADPDQFKGYDALAAAPTAPELVVSGNFGGIVVSGEVWSTATWQSLGKIEHAKDESYAKYAYSADGKWIGAAGMLGDCALWNAATRKQVAKLKQSGGAVNDVAFSRNGRMFATAGGENEIHVWKLPELK